MNDMQRMLQSLFRTKNPMTLAVSGTGSAGMEAAVVNLIEPGDSMIVCVNGVFGGRMVDVAERAGRKVTKVERPWGEVFTPADLKAALAKAKPKVVGIVMAETSTGAWQPIEEISKLVHDAGALLLVDAVTSLGGVPVEVDGWNIDAIYSGTQKCLSCPPGLAPVSFNPRAMDVDAWPQDEGAKLVSRRDDAGQVLGHGAGLSPHRADQHDLRRCTRPCGWCTRKGWKPASPGTCCNHRALKAGLAAIGIEYTAAGGASTADAQRRADSRRRGRRRGPQRRC